MGAQEGVSCAFGTCMEQRDRSKSGPASSPWTAWVAPPARPASAKDTKLIPLTKDSDRTPTAGGRASSYLSPWPSIHRNASSTVTLYSERDGPLV
jgi:hypothetical protein